MASEGDTPAPAAAAAAAPEVAQAGVADGGVGNATFIVERRVQIESDNKPHKATIGGRCPARA